LLNTPLHAIKNLQRPPIKCIANEIKWKTHGDIIGQLKVKTRQTIAL
jgi:hypothetical protein